MHQYIVLRDKALALFFIIKHSERRDIMAPNDNVLEKDLQALVDNEKEEQEIEQKQVNKQINYNPFIQKVVIKQGQGQKAENEAESEAEAKAIAEGEVESEQGSHGKYR